MGLIHTLQLQVFRLMAFCRPNWKVVLGFAPIGFLHCGGRLPLVSYKEIFVDQDYSSPIPLELTGRILDLGAHLGLAALFFARAYPKAQIDCYEPNPEAAILLKKNLSNCTNVRVHCAGVSSKNGSSKLFVENIDGIPTDATINAYDRKKSGKNISVPILDIRDLISSEIDFIKMDIEGSEYNCLEVLDATPERIHCLAIEFHEAAKNIEKVHSAVARLIANGYRIFDKRHKEIDQPLKLDSDVTIIWAIANQV